jgi:hypothetical protein
MTDIRRGSLFAAFLVASALTVAACGGAAATAAPTPSPVGEATPTPAEATPTVEPTPVVEATASPEATPDLAIPSFDLSALTGGIPGASSYRSSFSVGGVEQYRSVVVTKPELSKEITLLDNGEVGTRIIIIGKNAWMATGADGKFDSVPESLATSMLAAFDPTTFINAYRGLDWVGSATDKGIEQKNGINARHLRIDSTSAVAAAKMPAGSAIDIWIADQGYVVAWETTGFAKGEDVAIEISGVDDPANVIKPPS